MREGWEIKTLGEVCEIYQPTTLSTKELDESGRYFVYGANGIIGRYSKYNHEESEVILTCRGSTCGTINVSLPFSWINGNAMVVRPKDKTLLKEYLKYLLRGIDYSKVITGAAQPQITRIKLAPSVISFPKSIPEQQRIVDILDREFAKIDALKANAEKSLQAAKDLFQAVLKKELKPKEGWTQETLFAVSTEMFAGGDAPKNQMADTPSKEYPIPIIANAVENEGLYGYTSIARVSVPSITIAGRGSGTGYVFRRRYSYFPIVRLIVIIPNDNKVCLDYLYFAIKSLNIQSSGSAIPQLTIPMIKNYLIAYPAKSIQEVIVKRLTQMEEGYFQLKENYQKTLTLCDDLKQSLLRKAFNGEL